MNKCNVIRDLLPLYADKVCSEDSKEMVEEHLAECNECKQELEDYCYNTGIDEVSTDVVMKNFKKKMGKKNFIKVIVSVLLCLIVGFGGYYILFVPEYVVPYHDGLVEANIPIDKGIDVWVNLNNYLKVQPFDLVDEEGYTDIYITVLQNNFTKIFPDSDTTDHLWRINRDMSVCFQSGFPYPLTGDEPKVRNIYYLEMHPNETLKMVDEINFDAYNKTLIWTSPEFE